MSKINQKYLRMAVRELYEKNPKQMTPMMARKLQVSEGVIMQHLPEDVCHPLSLDHLKAILECIEEFGHVYVIINSGVAVMECEGEWSGLSMAGAFFNVQSETIDMHIFHDQIDKVYAVIKPGHTDGVMTHSFQFFDANGRPGFKVFLSFGTRELSKDKQQLFMELIERFR